MKAANAKKAAMELTEELAKELAADLRNAGIGSRRIDDGYITFEIETGGGIAECEMVVEFREALYAWPDWETLISITAVKLDSGEVIAAGDIDVDPRARRDVRKACRNVVAEIVGWAEDERHAA